jgi:hypothetical protein
LKVKSVKSSPAFPSDLELPLNTNIDTATTNVLARIYNTKHVKEAMGHTLNTICEILGLEEDGLAAKKKKVGKEKVSAKASEDEDPGQRRPERLVLKEVTRRPRNTSFSSVEENEEELFNRLAKASDESANAWGEDSQSIDLDQREVSGDSDFDSESYAAFDARLASSSEDEHEGGNDSILRAAVDSQLKSELLASVKDISLDTDRVDSTEEEWLGFSDTPTDKRPPKSVEVAKRLIHNHLGIKLPRTPNSMLGSAEDDGRTTETESPPERVESHIVPSNSDDFESASPLIEIPKANTSSKRATVEGRNKHEPPKIAKSKRDRMEEASDQDTPKPLRTMATKASTSTFVPSLNMVGYWSGSESEASDVEEHVAPRKNRRGQRARQKIWEQKFGGSAKHLSEEAKAKQKGRDDGWDAKRGATGKDDGWRKGKGSTWKGKDYNGETGGANAIPVAIVKRGTNIVLKKNGGKDDDGPLHPSWEAKKIAKSKVAIVPFQGKKITFT